MGDTQQTTDLAAVQPSRALQGGPTSDQFAVAEEIDNCQIEIEMEGGTSFDQYIFYQMLFKNKATGKMEASKPELSATGVRALELVLSQRHRLSIVESRVEMVKYDEKDRSTWRYEAFVKMRNETTGHDSVGACTRRFQPDPKLFNRRSCLEIARLKAMKGQLPIKEIYAYWEQITDNGKNLDVVRQIQPDEKPITDTITVEERKPASEALLEALEKTAELRFPGTGKKEVEAMRGHSAQAINARMTAIDEAYFAQKGGKR